MADRIIQLKAMLAAEPHDAFCTYGLAIEHAKLGRFAEALEWFDRTIELDPDYCYAYFHKAKSQEQAGDVTGSLQTLRTGLARAKAAGDAKAASELQVYLDELGE